MKALKHWANKIRHNADEFRGRFAGIIAMLDGDLPKAVAALEKTILILESYAEIARPMNHEEKGQ